MTKQIDRIISVYENELRDRRSLILRQGPSKKSIKRELAIINDQLDSLDGIREGFLSKQLLIQFIPDAEYQADDAEVVAVHMMKNFRLKIMAESHDYVEVVEICLDRPSRFEIWDYIKDNNCLRQLKICTLSSSLSENFINSIEFCNAVKTAKNLMYIEISIPDMGVSEEEIEEFRWRVGPKKIAKFLQDHLDSDRPLIIKWSDPEGNIIFLKDPSRDTIDVIGNCLQPDFKTDLLDDCHDIKEFLQNEEKFNLTTILHAIGKGLLEVEGGVKESKFFYKPKLMSFLIDLAVRNNDILTVSYFIAAGIDLKTIYIRGNTSLHIAAAYATSSEMLRILLGIKLPMPDDQLELSQETRLFLEETNGEGNTPLLVAAQNGKKDNIKFLLKCGGNIFHRNNSKQSACDLSMNRGYLNCLLVLLDKGGDFPDGIKAYVLATESDNLDAVAISKLIERHESLSNVILSENIQEIKLRVNGGELTRSFRSYHVTENNYSAPFFAFVNKKYCSYAFLRALGFNLFSSEELFLNCLSKDERDEIRVAMIPFIHRQEFSSVAFLLSRTRILQGDSSYYDDVRGMIYEKLAKIPLIRTVLEVLESSLKSMDIVFDFESDSVQDLSPTDEPETRGSCRFRERRIYIGAKVEHRELLGTVAHELTHLAIQIVFNNECNPYQADDITTPTELGEIINSVKLLTGTDVDEIIKRVFTVYKDETFWPSELIVRVPHMLAKYGENHGQAKLSQHEALRRLYDFYVNNVERRLKEFIEINRQTMLTADTNPATAGVSLTASARFDVEEGVTRELNPRPITPYFIMACKPLVSRLPDSEAVFGRFVTKIKVNAAI